MSKFITDLIGVSEKLFLGVGKSLLKSISNGIVIRNNADSADAELTASKINISGNSLVLNSDAVGDVGDHSITLSRPSAGMNANYELMFPTQLGTVGQTITLANATTGQLGWTTPSGGSSATESSIATPNTLALRDANGDFAVRKISIESTDASTSTTTGSLVLPGGLGVAGRVSAANFNGFTFSNATFTTSGSATILPTQNAVKTYADTFSVNTRTASYTLVLSDAGRLIEMNVASANTLTIPPDSSVNMAVGTHITIANIGAGITTITASAGVTLASGSNTLSQNQAGKLYKRAASDWVFIQFFFSSSGGSSDPFYSSVVLLLHCNGASESTTFSDYSSYNRSITRGGNTTISTAQQRYGTGSAFFDGNGDYLSCSALNLKSADFTIEAFVRFSSITNNQIIFTTYNQPGGAQANTLIFSISASKLSISNGVSNASGSALLSLGNWYHTCIQYQHSTTTISCWLNGVIQATLVAPITAEASSFFVGGSPGDNNIGTQWLWGYLTEIRVTRGVLRYSGNFSVPGAAFANS